VNDRLHCIGALALELTPGTQAATPVLAQAEAGELAGLIGRDLAKFAIGASGLDLTVSAGLYDPVELLRPGFPLHAELSRLLALAPKRSQSQVVAFGAQEGQLPASLQPDSTHAAGPLRLIPWLLRGDPAEIAAVGADLEDVLLETGMAGADTALLVQERFAAQIEHARYLTVHDLAAMTALQYEHAGLAPLWPLIETALLRPDDEAWLDAPPEPLARYRQGAVRLAQFDADAWAAGGWVPDALETEYWPLAFERFRMRRRQFAAVLAAHGIRVDDIYCRDGGDPRAALSD